MLVDLFLQVCGVPWTEHVGVQVLCKALEAAKAENERLLDYELPYVFTLFVYVCVDR